MQTISTPFNFPFRDESWDFMVHEETLVVFAVKDFRMERDEDSVWPDFDKLMIEGFQWRDATVLEWDTYADEIRAYFREGYYS